MRYFPSLVLLLLAALATTSATAQTLPDTGIWPGFAGDTTLRIPPWLRGHTPSLELHPNGAVAVLYLNDLPVQVWGVTGGALPADARTQIAAAFGHVPPITPSKHDPPDRDGDGIPDSTDVMIGARKTAINGAKYEGGFERITFPGGDVDRVRGVCTDVIVRALRNAGYDLQALIYRDMKRRRKAYGLGAGKSPNKHIEHRRVRRQIVWFKRHLRALSTEFDEDAKGTDAWLPGDIVFMDTFPSRPGPDHVGIVSDQTDEDGTPLVINNWTDGFHTQDMSLLADIPVTHRFRAGLGKSP
jgi:uncharacterized protein YijF (DUF1287 family)